MAITRSLPQPELRRYGFTAINQLSQITQQNASASEELAATAEEMSGQAELFQQLTGIFKAHRADPGFVSL